ncbi:MAG: energy-coupling factor ABC transporter ATP-binding protein [Bacteroidetes bacterium]|nr:energy-coupling factor ABC transporter ATP-binding protein [Bacteroidota bacterium]
MLISFMDFSLAYSEGSAPALKHIDLEINERESLVVSGLSGAGKSTLCLAAADSLASYPAAVTSGEIMRKVDSASNGGTAIVMQNFYAQITYLRSTVFEEVAFPCENKGLPRDEIIRRVEEALGRIGIGHLADRNPLELSGGEKQKVVLATALAMKPALLILDEPISQLDPESAAHLADVLAELKKEIALLIAENDPYLTLKVADRVVVLSEGEVIADGAFGRILEPGIEEHVELPAWTRCVSEAVKEKHPDMEDSTKRYELSYKSAIAALRGIR